MADFPIVGVLTRANEQTAFVETILELRKVDLEMRARIRVEAALLFLDELLQFPVQPLRMHGVQ